MSLRPFALAALLAFATAFTGGVSQAQQTANVYRFPLDERAANRRWSRRRAAWSAIRVKVRRGSIAIR